MLLRARKPGSLTAFGIVSSCAMPGGTFQYGLKTTCVISSAKIGVLLSGAPTTTRMSITALPFSIASRRKSGTFTMKWRSGIRSGSQRQRSRLSSIVTDALFDRNVHRAHRRRHRRCRRARCDAVLRSASRLRRRCRRRQDWNLFRATGSRSPSIASRCRSVGTDGRLLVRLEPRVRPESTAIRLLRR